MSAEFEVDEGYFLLRYTRNCVVEDVKRVCSKCGHGVGKKTSVFLLRVTHLTNASKRDFAKFKLAKFKG